LEQNLSGENITEYMQNLPVFFKSVGKNKRRSLRRQLPRSNVLYISLAGRIITLTVTTQRECNTCVSGCFY